MSAGFVPNANFLAAHFVRAVQTLASAFDSLVDLTVFNAMGVTGSPCAATKALPVMALDATYEPAVLDVTFARLVALTLIAFFAGWPGWTT